jgi:hypothetical protein
MPDESFGLFIESAGDMLVATQGSTQYVDWRDYKTSEGRIARLPALHVRSSTVPEDVLDALAVSNQLIEDRGEQVVAIDYRIIDDESLEGDDAYSLGVVAEWLDIPLASAHVEQYLSEESAKREGAPRLLQDENLATWDDVVWGGAVSFGLPLLREDFYGYPELYSKLSVITRMPMELEPEQP